MGGPEELAGQWRREIARTSLVAMDRAAMLAFLTELARDALAAVRGPAPGHGGTGIGGRLVGAHFTEPAALQRSVSLLSRRLPAAVADLPDGADRVAELLGGLAAGYTSALQALTRHEQEQITTAAFAARSAAEARFESVFDVAVIGIAVSALDGEILEVNRALAGMLGYRPEDIVGRRFWEWTHPTDVPGTWEQVQDMVAGVVDHVRMEKSYFGRDGTSILTNLVLSLIRDEAGAPRFVVSLMENITDQRRLQDRLRHQATHDPLTGLPNRALFFDRLDTALAVADAEAGPGLCYLDLDGFKAVNDTLGHDAGDALLRTVAQRLLTALGADGHLVARMGGDEFVVLVERSPGVERLHEVAATALEAVRPPVPLPGRTVAVTASVGVVQYGEGAEHRGSDAAELMKAADTTMYWAKSDGQDRIALFDAERHQRDVDRFAMMARMPEALARSEFVVEYQPLVRMRDLEVVGVEALVRWRLPDGSLLGPADFIPLAEQTGLIVALGHDVLATACRQAGAWAAAGMPLLMSVNLAGRQVREPGLVSAVAAVLDETGCRPDLLQLELTESDLMGSDPASVATLRELADLGIRIAIDDFGTGYSNLAYLRHLPVHTLKLAGPFITGGRRSTPSGAGEVDVEVVASIVQLAHALGLSVTAESIETTAQQQRLLGLGCDTGQGWLFAPSLPAEAVPGLVTGPR